MVERIRELLRAREWQPFTIHRVGGDSICVRTREHVLGHPLLATRLRKGAWANRGSWSEPDGPDHGRPNVGTSPTVRCGTPAPLHIPSRHLAVTFHFSPSSLRRLFCVALRVCFNCCQ